ncbi:glutathione hydrolase 1 proenzyme isoform X2 [Agrilus planipennis]|uniref:Glutathione hydrolase 1 proenzyme isoform X2 n=1 Tax=Agrilus planipennis TaxID=224129 RepID=A0A1W4WGT8_AGRPL|nr:glutathione hydrolase 1 proenzyme isoform X2 [Agrilus planipennis]XP_018319318.1 glutathione hydrolase 1 proenzyme isoform X2 [Agrilus planipennis]
MAVQSMDISKDGSTKRNLYCRPSLSRGKKIGILALILLILVCFLVAFLLRTLANDDNKELVPPNPTKQLPSSASKLKIFKKAAVCADGPPCAEIGKSILEQNGSAVDAALAAMFCNGLVNMQSMGLGGGFFMTIYTRDTKTAVTLDAREAAPLKATPDMYKTDHDKSKKGILAVGVPGELKGYWAAHQRFGKLPWNKIIEPTIELCERGYNISKVQYDGMLSSPHMKNDPVLKEWFVNEKGNFNAPGTLVRPTKLCDTLRLIAQNGGDDFYTGNMSRMIVNDIKELGGIINEEDLKVYTAKWREPISVTFQNEDRLYSVPPPASGVLLGFILRILDGYNFSPDSINTINDTVLTYHRTLEAFKYAYARRTELGDLNYVNITSLLNNLTSSKYAEQIRKKIDDTTTSQKPEDYGAVFYNQEDHGTAHISVLAENGDAVSATSSVNLYFGAGITSKSTGIVLNSVMDDFSFPYYKNYFGLPGSPSNSLQPGKRSLSSMSPSIVTDKNGDVRVVIGASGGTKITTAVALVIMRTLWFGQNIKEAIDAPRIHHQIYPMKVSYEYGNLQQVVEGLQKKGHKMERYSERGSIICALLIKNSTIFANADYRKGGEVYGLD